jgi:glycosyltransferase involved in cell wall biosynthesis
MKQPSPMLLMTRSLGQGGSERQLTEMAIALTRRGWPVHVSCFAAGGIRAEDLARAGVPVLPLGLRSFRSLSIAGALWRLARYRRFHKLEILHAFDYPSNFLAVLAGRLCGFSYVITSQRSSRELRSPYWRRLLRWTDKRADAIVVNCAALRDHMTGEEGVPAARIHLCYNGLDSSRFPVRRGGTSGAGLVTGVVCALRPEKGLGVLLEAFAAVSGSHPEARLMIAGSGPEREKLEDHAAALGIGQRCQWYPSAADVSPWLQQMDVFVLPSESEAFSNSLLEAMSSGCAVVASDVGGSPEMVEHEQTGLLFPSKDAAALAGCLERLLSSPSLRDRLAAAAAARVRERFTIARAAEALEDVYRSVTVGQVQ